MKNPGFFPSIWKEDVSSSSSSRSGPLLLLLLPGWSFADRRDHQRHHLVPGRHQLGVSGRQLPRQPGSALHSAISQAIFYSHGHILFRLK